MKIRLFTTILVLIFNAFFLLNAQNSGVYSSYVILDTNNSNNYYQLKNDDGDNVTPFFEATNLGSFDCNQPLLLNGFENKTFQINGDDVQSNTLHYRIYISGNAPGAFNTLTLNKGDSGSFFIGGNNTQWQLLSENISLSDGLENGDYVLEIYSSAFVTYPGGSYTFLVDNNSQNYKAFFTVSNTFELTCNDITLYLDESGNTSIGANSVEDFSDMQGAGNWSYGQYFAFETTNFELMPNYNVVNVFPSNADAWNNAENAFSTPFLYDSGGHPGQDLKWAVRRWTSNMDGTIYISGEFFDVNLGGGDGANVRIFKNNTQEFEFLNIPGSATPYNLTLTVVKGDTIDFAIDPKQSYTFDTTHFTANIDVVYATDNCGIDNISLSTISFNCSNIGNGNSVSSIATDVNGNTSNCIFNVNVIDDIAPGQTTFPAPDLALQNIPEASLYNLVYELNIPIFSDWNENSQVPYAVNNVSQLNGKPINKVAYLVQLDSKWVWVSFDAITQNYNQIGIPVDYIKQQVVNNMNVVSSSNSGVTSGNFSTGNIEFWSWNYGTGAGLGSIPIGNNGIYDFNDSYNGNPDGYGSFQVHNYNNAQTIFGFNRWSTPGAPNDLGIGNNTNFQNGPHTDWTYTVNANTYSTKKLYVLVLNAPLEDLIVSYGDNAVPVPSIEDNCDGPVIGVSDISLPIESCEPFVAQWTFTDSSGNSSVLSQNIIVEDNTPPTFVDSNGLEITSLEDIATCENEVEVPIPEVVDNCNINTALDFDGANDYILTSNHIIPNNDFTVQLWIFNRSISGFREFISQGASGDAFYIGTTNNSGVLRCGDKWTNTGVNLPLNQWVHISLTKTGNIARLYLDGNLVATNTNYSTTPNGNGTATLIGRQYGGLNEFPDAILDELRVWNRALSPGEISTSFNNIATGNEPGLVAYYNFEDGQGSSGLTDQTGNGNNGTLVNMDSSDDWISSTAPLTNVSLTNDFNGNSDASGTYPVGTTIVTWTATDAAGNTSTLTQTVTAGDDEAPVIDCSSDITVSADPGQCTAELVIVSPTISDNCIGGNALDFDGDDDYITVNQPIGTLKTIEFWFYTENGVITSDTYQMLFNFNNSILSYIATGHVTSSIPNETLSIVTNGGNGVLSMTEPIPAGWNHVAITSNGSSYNTIYLNGVSKPTTTIGSPNILAINSMIIGQRPQTPIQKFKGRLDEVRIWSSARTAQEIADNQNNELSAQTGLSALYNFNQGVAEGNNAGVLQLNDTSANNFNGTLENFSLAGQSSNWATGFNGTALTNDITGSADASDVYPVGTTTITWTATDASGNTSQCTQTVTVEDNEDPNMVTNSLTINLADRNDYVLSQAQIDELGALSSDNCELSFSITNGQTIYTCNDVGQTFDLELNGTDPSGNSASVIVQLSITDSNSVCNDPPTASCKDVVLTTGADCNATLLATDLNDGSSDPDGDPLTYTITEIDGSSVSLTSTVLSVGVYNVTLTVSDGEFEDTCTAQVSVVDSTPPVALTKPATVQLDASGNGSITPEDVDNGSSDACGVTLSVSPSTFDCSNVGANTVTLTVTDDNGNVSTETATVTVEDNVTPIALTKPATVQLDASGNGSIIPEDVDNGSSDACGVTLSVSPSTFTCDDVGANTVTLTVTDDNGNVSTETATLTVEDNVTPIALTKPATVQLDASGNGSIIPEDVDNGSSDACGVTLSVSPSTFTCDDVGANTVTLTVTDDNGNVSTETATVTVEDNVAPIALTKPATVQLDASGNGSITPEDVDNGSSDACGVTLSVSPSTFDCSNVGANTVTLTVTDDNGNVSTETATVTVEDNVAPIALTKPATVQLDASGNGSIIPEDVDNGSSDACGVTLSVSPSTFTCDDVGANTVTLTVTDDNGNVSTETATVTVEDNVAPIALTKPATVELDASGNGSIIPEDVDNGSSDACGVTLSVSPNTFDCSNVGANTVTLTVTDDNGNVSTETATVTVEDNVAPIALTKPATVQLDASGNGSITPENVDNGSSDACGVTLSVSPNTFDCSNVGANTVTLTVTDDNGNVSTETATVTVEDNVAPIALTKPATVQLDALGNGSITPEDVDNGSNDACGIASLSVLPNTFDCSNIGENTVTLTVTDVNGNVSTNTAIVTIEDDIPAMVLTQDITIQLDANGGASIVPADVDNGSNDACGIASLSVLPNTFDCSNIGANTVMLTATDNNGNVSTNTSTVTVIDEIAPVINCAQIEVILQANGTNTLTDEQEDLIEASVSDNCEIASIVLAQTAFSCSDIGGDLDELIISEYVDGSENGDVANKYIEIFNGTGTAINLSELGYELVVYGDNFNPSPITIQLLGVIQDRDVHVISFPSAELAGTQADQVSQDLIFNGNDAIALTKNGSAVDILGVIGEHPTGGWASGNISTQGTTLIRNIDVLQGNVLGDNSDLGSEWTSYSLDYFNNLGQHTIDIEGNNNNVLLTVIDTSGNVSTCEVQVLVIDDTNPDVVTKDIEVFLDENGDVTITPTQVNDGSTDSCGIANLALDNSEFNCGDVGPNTVTLTVTDVNGNSATETAVVTVTDNLDPIVVTQDITVALDANGNASITPNQIDNGSSDNCEIDELTLDVSSFTCADVGANIVTLNALDVNGNSSSETAVVTIEDNTSPNAVCQNISVTLNSEGKATITGADVDGGSADACGISSLSVFPNEFGCDDIGDNQVTLTVTDNNGNESTCTATVMVNGDIPTVNVTQSDLPEFCQGAFVILTAEGTNINTYEWFYEDDLVGTDSTYEVEVGHEGLYEVVVTSATNCIASTTFTVNPIDFGGLLSAYTILGTEEVFLTGSNTVISGGVGAMLPGAGNVKLHQASTVADFTQAETISLQQGSTTGQQILSPANPTLPVFMFNTVSNATSPDIIVTGNQTLTGDVYDVIDVREGATVTFTQPNVFINELKTQKESAIEFTGCTNVLLNERFQLAQNSTINSNEENVTFYVDDDVSIEKGSSVTASIFAYNHNLLVKGLNGNGNKEPEPTYMNGLFIANRVQGNKNVIWNAFDTCESCEVEYPNANRKTKDDLVVTEFDAKGWPSPSTTAFNLKVETLNKSDKVNISVFDVANKLVHKGQFNHNTTYKFGDRLEGGVYIVRITQGSSLKVLRLIKE